MTKREILTKAVQKAHAGGWKPDDRFQWIGIQEFIAFDFDMGCPDKWHKFKFNELLFNHDFAKALWGDDLMHGFKGNNLGQTQQFHEPSWQHHLQQMVIANDPIKYLGEHI